MFSQDPRAAAIGQPTKPLDLMYAEPARAYIEAHGGDWVFADGHGYNEGYFESLDDLLQWCDDEGIEPPCYVHPCYPTAPPEISLEGALEHMLEQEPEGIEARDLPGMDALEAAVAAFNKLQTSCSWMWAAREVIILDVARFEHLLSTDRSGLPDVSYIRRSPSAKSAAEMAHAATPAEVC